MCVEMRLVTASIGAFADELRPDPTGQGQRPVSVQQFPLFVTLILLKSDV